MYLLPRVSAIRSIPDFAREADFLRLLPRGADVDPNDPRHGNVMRMRGLLSALGLGRRESSVAAHAAVAEASGGRRSVGGVGPTTKTVGGLGVGAGNEAVGRGGEEEEAGVFRASQEQQALVFLGKRASKGWTGAAGRSDGSSGGSSAFHTFAYNNHRRRERATYSACIVHLSGSR